MLTTGHLFEPATFSALPINYGRSTTETVASLDGGLGSTNVFRSFTFWSIAEIVFKYVTFGEIFKT